jgi:hypothetical protein
LFTTGYKRLAEGRCGGFLMEDFLMEDGLIGGLLARMMELVGR